MEQINQGMQEHGQIFNKPANAGVQQAQDRPAQPAQRDVAKPAAQIPDGAFANHIQRIEKADIEKRFDKDVADKLSDKNTGVKLDHIYYADYPGAGQTIAGFDKDGKQVLLLGAGSGIYINPNQQELADLGKPDGKSGWYLKDDKGLQKTKYDDYRFSPRDGLFVVRQNDGSASAWSGDGKTIKGTMNATGAFIQTNADGTAKSIRRADNTELVPHYDDKNLKDGSGKLFGLQL